MLHSLPKHWGIYHIEDNINCLELGIYLRFINSIVKLPKYEIKSHDRGRTWSFCNHYTQLQLQQQEPPSDAEDEYGTIKVVVVKWQQKLLSPREVELYRNLENCTNDVQKKYHQYLRTAKHSDTRQRQKSRKRLNRNYASSTRSKADTKAIDIGDGVFTYINDDKYGENRNQSNETYTNDDNVEVMYIYANLNPNKMLAQLKWDKRQRILQIYPDFSQFNTCPYLIEVNTDYRHLYMYGIRNTSTMRHIKPYLNLNISNIVGRQPYWCPNADNITQKFINPSKRTQRSVLLLEIQNLHHFANDNIHVRYKAILPAHTLLEEGLLEGSTHTVVTASAKKFTMANVGYCWQLTILCEEDYDPNNPLTIIFEVISIDYWQRERSEGYAYCNFNLSQPGTECMALVCTRLKDNLWHKIKNYLIGGRHRFDYYEFISSNRLAAGNDEPFDIRNYYGIRIETTGQLLVKCQKMIHRNYEILHPSSSSSNRANQGMTLDDIMMAYQEARKRAQANHKQLND